MTAGEWVPPNARKLAVDAAAAGHDVTVTHTDLGATGYKIVTVTIEIGEAGGAPDVLSAAWSVRPGGKSARFYHGTDGWQDLTLTEVRSFTCR